jgi:hypothetical protein
VLNLIRAVQQYAPHKQTSVAASRGSPSPQVGSISPCYTHRRGNVERRASHPQLRYGQLTPPGRHVGRVAIDAVRVQRRVSKDTPRDVTRVTNVAVGDVTRVSKVALRPSEADVHSARQLGTSGVHINSWTSTRPAHQLVDVKGAHQLVVDQM